MIMMGGGSNMGKFFKYADPSKLKRLRNVDGKLELAPEADAQFEVGKTAKRKYTTRRK